LGCTIGFGGGGTGFGFGLGGTGCIMWIAIIFFTTGWGGGVLLPTQNNPPTSNASNTAPTNNARPKCSLFVFSGGGVQDGLPTIVFTNYLPCFS
jgi:hypothetical protein